MVSRFHGVIVPLITPFKDDYSIDFGATRWLIRRLVEKGVHGIFPYSTTGEFVHLKPEEGVELVKTVMEEVAGRAYVIPGISANCTEHSIEMGLNLKDLGVDGVIVTPPYFFNVGREGLKLHFARIAEKIDLPIIVYNIPSTTGINIPIETYVELAEEYSNIVGAKVTYSNLSYLRKLIQDVKDVRRDFSILTGLDEYFLYTLMIGGDGGIMALANIAPQIHIEIYNAWIKGDFTKAYREFKNLLELVKIYDVATSYPTAIKTTLKVLNTPIKPYVRPPLTLEKQEVEEEIKKIISRLRITL